MQKLLCLTVLAVAIPQLAVAQDDVATKGKAAFRQCSSCHSVGEGATNRMGPELNGVMGAPVATRPGFSYSQALTKLNGEGVVWDEKTLTEFLHKPSAFAPGTKMTFSGLTDEQKIADIIAYLASFSPDYKPAAAGAAAPAAPAAAPAAPAAPAPAAPAAPAPAAEAPKM